METEISLNQNNQEEEGFYASYEEYFVDCCRFNDLDEAKLCIENGCDITWFDNRINNGLHMASANGHIEIIQLIKEQIDKMQDKQKVYDFINQKNEDQNTPLHWAAINGQEKIVEYLIGTLKVDPNIQNGMGKTAFDEAAQLNFEEVAKILAKVTKEDMSLYKDLEDYSQSGEDKEETISNS